MNSKAANSRRFHGRHPRRLFHLQLLKGLTAQISNGQSQLKEFNFLCLWMVIWMCVFPRALFSSSFF